MTRKTGTIVTAVITLLGCANGGQPAANAPAVTRPFTYSDFRKLSWLEGHWVGVEPNGNRFYEAYRMRDDSTLMSYSFADSISPLPRDSSVIGLRGGLIGSEGSGRIWLVSRLDSVSVHFVPYRGARNSFTWERLSEDEWRATLTDPATAEAKERTIVYPMRRR